MKSDEDLEHPAFRRKREEHLRLHAPMSPTEKEFLRKAEEELEPEPPLSEDDEEFMRIHGDEIRRYVQTIMQNVETRPKAKVLPFPTPKADETEQP